MNTILVPIYELRVKLLEKINPHFFKNNYDLILRTSLAAQDYVLSGNYHEYDPRMGHAYKTLPGYIKVHQKYKIPYNPELPQNCVNSGLVMDLAWAFRIDLINGVIDEKGNIRNTNALPTSEVLQVYHNSHLSGTPSTAFSIYPPSQIQYILNNVCRRTR